MFFLIGIALFSFLNSLLIIISIVFLLFFYLLTISKKDLALLFLFVIAGSLYAYLFNFYQLENINIPFEKNGDFEGIILDTKSGYSGQQLKVSLTGNYKGNINLKTGSYPELSYGDRIKFIGVIKQIAGDYRNYYLSKNIFGESDSKKVEIISRNNGNFIKSGLLSFRNKLKNIFNSSLPREKAAFLAGITIGGKEDFSKEFKDKMSLSGTTHLVALSGYNISIVILISGLIFSLYFSISVSFYLSILLVILFVIMTGGEASVVRAAIMGVIMILSVQSERLFSARNGIIIAAFIMALFNPNVLVFDVGFQLSFAALLGIVYLSPALEKIFKFQSPGLFSWKENALMTLAAQIMALPILIANFGVFSLTSILANILILEFIPLTMAIGFSLVLFGLFSDFLAKILGLLANIFISYEFFTIDLFSRFSIPIKILGTGIIFWLIYYTVIALFILFGNKKYNEERI